MKDRLKDPQNQSIPDELQLKPGQQYQANQTDLRLPTDRLTLETPLDQSFSEISSVKRKELENQAFTENEQIRKYKRNVAGDGSSRLL